MPRTDHVSSAAGFVADWNSIDRLDGRQIDWANVSESERLTPGQIVTTSGAAAAATSLPVTALTVAIPSGTVLNFLPGSGKFAKLTAAAAVGATSLTVQALPTTIANLDTAVFPGTGAKRLRAGTVVGTLLGAGKVSPRIVTTNPARGILETDAVEGDVNAALSGYGIIIGGAIYEALLPEASGSPRVLAAAVKTELDTPGQGTGFAFLEYIDTR
jgi:hypothetical protein